MTSTNSIFSARQTGTLARKPTTKVISFFKSELFLFILACYFALFICVSTIVVAALATGEFAVVW